MNPAAAQKLVEQGKVGEIMKFATEHVAEDARRVVLQGVLRSTVIAQALLKESCVDRLIELVSREKDPATRGQLLGMAVASSAGRSNFRGRALAELLVKLAKQEKEPHGRRELVGAFLAGNNIPYYLSDADSVLLIWRLVRDEDDKAWQSKTVAMLLRSPRAYSLFSNKEEANWAMQLVRHEAAAPVREELLGFLLGNQQTVGVLIGQGHFDAMLTLAKELPDR
ncbi:MAG: hypothetical protein CMJ64_03430 [Planctomycetaceae bacterium]|nr:hypothetical protein [Planctomycetaceae bacterium]